MMHNKMKLIASLKSLRKSLGDISQSRLARLMKVSSQTISAWEANGMKMIPSPKHFIALGNMSGFPECLYFFEQAGLTEQIILDTASKIRNKSTYVPDLPDEPLKGYTLIEVQIKSSYLDAIIEQHIPIVLRRGGSFRTILRGKL